MACSPTNSDLMLRWRWLAKQVIWNEYRWGELASVEQPHGRRLERAQFNVEWPLVSLIQSANSNHWVLGTTNRILRAGLILLMAMPIEEETCMYDGEWHFHSSHIVADESTRASPSGEMHGMDLMQGEGEDYDGLGRTSSCSYLWMMSWCFFFIFSQLGFYMAIGCKCATGSQLDCLASGITKRRGVRLKLKFRTSSCSCQDDDELMIFFQIWFLLWRWSWSMAMCFWHRPPGV